MLDKIKDLILDRPAFFRLFLRIVTRDWRSYRQVIAEEICLQEDERLLDIACGPATLSELFPKASYLGIDINPGYVSQGQKLGYCLQCMDALNPGFADETFDHILIVAFIHHLPDNKVRRLLSQVKRVLRTEGRVVVIENMQITSKWNLLGRFLVSLDRGRYIRTQAQYADLLKPCLSIQKQYQIKTGVYDQAVFVLSKTK